MATIRERKNKDGTTSYQAVVRVAGQPDARRTFPDRKSAELWASITTVEAKSTGNTLPNAGKFRRTMLDQAILDWSKHKTCPVGVHKAINSVRALAGRVALGHLNRNHVLAYIDLARSTPSQYGRPYSDASILKHLSVLRGAVKHAASTHNIKFDLSIFSVDGIKGEWDKERERILSYEEEEILKATVRMRRYAEHWELLIDLAIETAAREQELVLAELSEVFFDIGIWKIPKEHTKAGYAREIPLSKKAMQCMLRLRQLLADENARCAAKGEPVKKRLFWRHANPSSVCTGFAKIVDRAKLVDFRFHDLKHTAITRMVINKRELEVHEIMRIAGHKNIKHFYRYSHLRADSLIRRMN